MVLYCISTNVSVIRNDDQIDFDFVVNLSSRRFLEFPILVGPFLLNSREETALNHRLYVNCTFLYISSVASDLANELVNLKTWFEVVSETETGVHILQQKEISLDLCKNEVYCNIS